MINGTQKITIFILALLLSATLKSQDFKQLKVVKDSIEEYHSLLTLSNFEAFGKNQNLLFAYIDERRIHDFEIKNPVKFIDSNGKAWQFSIFNTETGKVNFLTNKINGCVPISFLNNESLILRDTNNNSFINFNIFSQKINKVEVKVETILKNLPTDFVYYIFKFNKNNNKFALIKRNDIDNLFIYYFQDGSLTKKEINPDKYLNSWNCNDVFWVDDENLLLFLVRINKQGNDLEFSQAIYNINYDSVVFLTMPKNCYAIEDFYNGQCIFREKKDKRSFVIYRLDISNNHYQFNPTYLIDTDSEPNDFIPHLGFISQDRIGFTTAVNGERGIVVLSMNIRKGYNDYCKLEFKKYLDKKALKCPNS
jgi:hypothetical protein